MSRPLCARKSRHAITASEWALILAIRYLFPDPATAVDVTGELETLLVDGCERPGSWERDCLVATGIDQLYEEQDLDPARPRFWDAVLKGER